MPSATRIIVSHALQSAYDADSTTYVHANRLLPTLNRQCHASDAVARMAMLAIKRATERDRTLRALNALATARPAHALLLLLFHVFALPARDVARVLHVSRATAYRMLDEAEQALMRLL